MFHLSQSKQQQQPMSRLILKAAILKMKTQLLYYPYVLNIERESPTHQNEKGGGLLGEGDDEGEEVALNYYSEC